MSQQNYFCWDEFARADWPLQLPQHLFCGRPWSEPSKLWVWAKIAGLEIHVSLAGRPNKEDFIKVYGETGP